MPNKWKEVLNQLALGPGGTQDRRSKATVRRAGLYEGYCWHDDRRSEYWLWPERSVPVPPTAGERRVGFRRTITWRRGDGDIQT